MTADPIPEQPSARSGEVLAPEGRWNLAALKRINTNAAAGLTWTEGTLGFSISMNGVVIGRMNRHMRSRPWTVSIQGFEHWHEPTRIIKHWHYTPNGQHLLCVKPSAGSSVSFANDLPRNPPTRPKKLKPRQALIDRPFECLYHFRASPMAPCANHY